MPRSAASEQVGARLRHFREITETTSEDIESALSLGPGWLSRFESGEVAPSIEMLLAILRHIGVGPADFFDGLELPSSGSAISRRLNATRSGDDLLVHFDYGRYDAVYRLSEARLDDFEGVIQEMRGGLSRLVEEGVEVEAIKTDAVVRTFLRAANAWPHANPSDLWWFVVYRAYCDPFNHPAQFARLDFAQSWKRTGGWALEEVLARHYGPFLERAGIRLEIASGPRKLALVEQLHVADRLEPDKVDVLITGSDGSRETCFGVVHVKSSFAERRTDDVPLSRSLVEAGYVSPLWTMDCKSSPASEPRNRGELGAARAQDEDRRSAKRRDIEDDGYFSACFSYNSNTVPTPDEQKVSAKIIVCNFRTPDDEFSRYVIDEWQRFQERGSLG